MRDDHADRKVILFKGANYANPCAAITQNYATIIQNYTIARMCSESNVSPLGVHESVLDSELLGSNAGCLLASVVFEVKWITYPHG